MIRPVAVLAFTAAVCAAADFEQRVIDNGLTVIVHEDHTAPVVTICIAVRTGATCQTPGTCGLAHFYEHMFFKGNASLPDQTAYNRRLRELGIIQNGLTSDEAVRYFITLDSRRLEEGLEFMYYAIATPLFDEEEIEREREIVLNEYQRNTTSPYWNLWLAQEQVVFGRAPWRASTIGRPEIIASAGAGAMREFRDRYYTPDNCALIVSGDVESETVFSASASAMGSWEYGGRSDYQSLEPFARIDRDTTVHLDSPSGITYVSIVFPGPPLAEDPGSTYAADVWGSYLDLMSREFYADLVTNGPFTSVSAGYYTQRCDPTITLGGMVRDGKAREAVRALQSEIWQLCDSSYYDPAGLELAAEMIRRHRLLGEETAYDVAVESLAFWWIEWGSLDYYTTYLDMIDRVGAADIARFLDRYVDRRPCAVFVMEPAGSRL